MSRFVVFQLCVNFLRLVAVVFILLRVLLFSIVLFIVFFDFDLKFRFIIER